MLFNITYLKSINALLFGKISQKISYHLLHTFQTVIFLR